MLTLYILPSKQGDEEYACSPDLPGRVVKRDKRGGSGSSLGSEARNRTAVVFDTTRAQTMGYFKDF